MYELDEERGGSTLTFLCSCSLSGSTMRCQSCARALKTPHFSPFADASVLLLRWLKEQKCLAKASTSNMCLCISTEKKILYNAAYTFQN